MRRSLTRIGALALSALAAPAMAQKPGGLCIENASERMPCSRSRHRKSRASTRRVRADGGFAPSVSQVVDEHLARSA